MAVTTLPEAPMFERLDASDSGTLITLYRGKPQRGYTAAVLECWDGSADVLMATEDYDDWATMEHVYVVEIKDDGAILGFWAETSQFELK